MGHLYVVPTPVGNLSDMTIRAVEVLKEADYILSEDTRVSRRLLNHYSVENKLIPYHAANEHRETGKHTTRLSGSDANIAIISDAGTPSISDPGYKLIRSCIDHGVPVTVLPGPAAFLPALVASGIPCNRFCFEGFLPHKKGRKKRIASLQEEDRTMVFYESPYRILKLINELSEAFGPSRQASVSREISKMYEETRRGTLEELADFLTAKKNIKGEFVLVVAGKDG